MKTKRRKNYKNKKTFRKKKRKQSYKKKIFRKQSYKKKSFKGGNGDQITNVTHNDDPTGETDDCKAELDNCKAELAEYRSKHIELQSHLEAAENKYSTLYNQIKSIDKSWGKKLAKHHEQQKPRNRNLGARPPKSKQMFRLRPGMQVLSVQPISEQSTAQPTSARSTSARSTRRAIIARPINT